MADEVEMIPVAGAEPPKPSATIKLNPMTRAATGAAKPATTGLKPGLKLPPKPGATVSTLRPGLKLPPKPGATVSTLRPGIKLPPKPGATATALRPGIKLPPKPGATVSAFRPGVKLPPKPGATATALRPGIKLPPKPVIRKPGSTAATASLPKPVAVDAQGVGKLPTVEEKSIARDQVATPPVSSNPKPLEALKSVTQKLKGITQEIPQQAILRKTGIIAESALTEGQKDAAKHKTARISLSDAMGVAPVKDEALPMKTIRIKRPIDISGATSPASPTAEKPASAPTTPVPPASPTAETPTTTGAKPAPVTMTQRKTLKIARPGMGVKPAGKFSVKRPTAPAVKPEAAANAPKASAGEVADIPDMPATSVPPLPAAAPAPKEAGFGTILATIVQLAACAVVGVLAWLLYENAQLATFCGGLGWGA